jgi:hypothetical protein
VKDSDYVERGRTGQSPVCHCRAAVVIKPVSADSLRKTGIFADKAGDFRRFPPQVRRTGIPETKSYARKAGISGPFSRFLGSLPEHRNGWLETEGSNSRIPDRTLSPTRCRRHLGISARTWGPRVSCSVPECGHIGSCRVCPLRARMPAGFWRGVYANSTSAYDAARIATAIEKA